MDARLINSTAAAAILNVTVWKMRTIAEAGIVKDVKPSNNGHKHFAAYDLADVQALAAKYPNPDDLMKHAKARLWALRGRLPAERQPSPLALRVDSLERKIDTLTVAVDNLVSRLAR